MPSCLFECLREAHLEEYYPNFAKQGVTKCHSLIALSMPEYAKFGVVSMTDRLRLFKLVQIVKSVEVGGQQCQHEVSSKSKQDKSMPPHHGSTNHKRSRSKSRSPSQIQANKNEIEIDRHQSEIQERLHQHRPHVIPAPKFNTRPFQKTATATVEFKKGSDTPVFRCRKVLTFSDNESDEDNTSTEILEQLRLKRLQKYGGNDMSNRNTRDRNRTNSDLTDSPDKSDSNNSLHKVEDVRVKEFPATNLNYNNHRQLKNSPHSQTTKGSTKRHGAGTMSKNTSASKGNTANGVVRPGLISQALGSTDSVSRLLGDQVKPHLHQTNSGKNKEQNVIKTQSSHNTQYSEGKKVASTNTKNLMFSNEQSIPINFQQNRGSNFHGRTRTDSSENIHLKLQKTTLEGDYEPDAEALDVRDLEIAQQPKVLPFKPPDAFMIPSREKHAYFPKATEDLPDKETQIETIYHTKGYNYGVPSEGLDATADGVSTIRSSQKIKVCIRKRPLTKKEVKRQETDIVKVPNPHTVTVEEAKFAIDLTKYIQQHVFGFDDVFDVSANNEYVYERTVKPMMPYVLQNRGIATCFAFGQTGAGKTHTLLGSHSTPGLYQLAVRDIFKVLSTDPARSNLKIWVSYYEIYCSYLFDLLNKRRRLHVRENGKQKVCIAGLTETQIKDVKSVVEVVNYGNSSRSTGSSGANPNSSRSHAILQIEIRDSADQKHGRLTFIDLAGSERAADANGLDRQTRHEGAEINQSLLALKECIRAIDQDSKHTPYRQSKLTHILRDSFVGSAQTCMIANISPAQCACENTLNTLQYADRVRDIRRTSPKSSQKSSPNLSLATEGSPVKSKKIGPAIFHPSNIQYASTPKGPPIGSVHMVPMDISMVLKEAYESPIRGHRLTRSKEAKVNNQELIQQRNRAAEKRSSLEEFQQRSPLRNHPQIDHRRKSLENPDSHDGRHLHRHEQQDTVPSNSGTQSSSDSKNSSGKSEILEEHKHVLTQLDNIMDRAKEAMSKSSRKNSFIDGDQEQGTLSRQPSRESTHNSNSGINHQGISDISRSTQSSGGSHVRRSLRFSQEAGGQEKNEPVVRNSSQNSSGGRQIAEAENDILAQIEMLKSKLSNLEQQSVSNTEQSYGSKDSSGHHESKHSNHHTRSRSNSRDKELYLSGEDARHRSNNSSGHGPKSSRSKSRSPNREMEQKGHSYGSSYEERIGRETTQHRRNVHREINSEIDPRQEMKSIQKQVMKRTISRSRSHSREREVQMSSAEMKEMRASKELVEGRLHGYKQSTQDLERRTSSGETNHTKVDQRTNIVETARISSDEVENIKRLQRTNSFEGVRLSSEDIEHIKRLQRTNSSEETRLSLGDMVHFKRPASNYSLSKHGEITNTKKKNHEIPGTREFLQSLADMKLAEDRHRPEGRSDEANRFTVNPEALSKVGNTFKMGGAMQQEGSVRKSAFQPVRNIESTIGNFDDAVEKRESDPVSNKDLRIESLRLKNEKGHFENFLENRKSDRMSNEGNRIEAMRPKSAREPRKREHVHFDDLAEKRKSDPTVPVSSERTSLEARRPMSAREPQNRNRQEQFIDPRYLRKSTESIQRLNQVVSQKNRNSNNQNQPNWDRNSELKETFDNQTRPNQRQNVVATLNTEVLGVEETDSDSNYVEQILLSRSEKTSDDHPSPEQNSHGHTHSQEKIKVIDSVIQRPGGIRRKISYKEKEEAILTQVEKDATDSKHRDEYEQETTPWESSSDGGYSQPLDIMGSMKSQVDEQLHQLSMLQKEIITRDEAKKQEENMPQETEAVVTASQTNLSSQKARFDLYQQMQTQQHHTRYSQGSTTSDSGIGTQFTQKSNIEQRFSLEGQNQMDLEEDGNDHSEASTLHEVQMLPEDEANIGSLKMLRKQGIDIEHCLNNGKSHMLQKILQNVDRKFNDVPVNNNNNEFAIGKQQMHEPKRTIPVKVLQQNENRIPEGKTGPKKQNVSAENSFEQLHSPLQTVKLSPGGTVFAPIHVFPVTPSSKHNITTPSVVIKTVVAQPIKSPVDRGNTELKHKSMRELKFVQKPDNDKNRLFNGDGRSENVFRTSHQSQDAVLQSSNEVNQKTPEFIRNMSAKEKTQHLLIMAHEEQLAEVTSLCKQEMKLLVGIKTGEKSFEDYTKLLKHILSSKVECITTLKTQMKQINGMNSSWS